MQPSWRWVLLWAVIAALVTAGLLLFSKPKDRTNEFTKSYMDVVLAVIGVAACVCALASQYALLPRKDKRICYRNPDAKAKVHHLAYITDAERDTLMDPEGHDALGDSFPGMFGTQGVPCYPKRAREAPWWTEVEARIVNRRQIDRNRRRIDEMREREAERIEQAVPVGLTREVWEAMVAAASSGSDSDSEEEEET
jgi:hypothetical protein